MKIKDFFEAAIEHKASDLHLVVGERPSLRVDGQLEPLDYPDLKQQELVSMLNEFLTKEQFERFKKEWELDFAYEVANKGRFRVNLHKQNGSYGMAARFISLKVPGPEEIGLNDTIVNLARLNQGLILVTGVTGSGKSTTLASLINIINKERKAHIITMEDPIEFVYERDQKSLIEQRQIGTDTHSFGAALKYVLRQDPDVILVGEMRDLETISATLTAAETGHLVFSTLHTFGAAETVERIVDVFPAFKQKQILLQLSSSLRAVISQQLLPRAGGGRVAAREILVNTPAVANLIRQNKIPQIASVIQTSAAAGMITMDKAIKNLLRSGTILKETADARLANLVVVGR